MTRKEEIREIKKSVIAQLKFDLRHYLRMEDIVENICDTSDILRLYEEELKQLKEEKNG